MSHAGSECELMGAVGRHNVTRITPTDKVLLRVCSETNKEMVFWPLGGPEFQPPPSAGHCADEPLPSSRGTSTTPAPRRGARL